VKDQERGEKKRWTKEERIERMQGLHPGPDLNYSKTEEENWNKGVRKGGSLRGCGYLVLFGEGFE